MATANFRPISAWLCDPEATYSEGLKLLKSHNPGHAFLPLLRTGEDAYTWPRLTSALKELLEASSHHEAMAMQPTRPAAEIGARLVLMQYDLPPDLQRIDQQWRRRYKEASRLHEALRRGTSDRSRASYAEQILDAFDEIRPAWEQLDHYREHGKLPEPPSPEASKGFDWATARLEDVQLVELAQRLINLGSYIVKHRQRSRKAKTADTALKHTAKAEAYTAERQHLFQLLEDADRTLATHHHA